MQDVIAILIVAFAAAFLARRGWRHFMSRSTGACGTCASCPASASTTQPLITISPLGSHTAAPMAKAGSQEV
ncbi:MAG TPA: FeoB-associated Cys-rich membrane protein [Lacipirellulaceae bacterium]|nr:FeoB-associated Cys-rich membrane protein [Lacipirellulaceae bacterium]